MQTANYLVLGGGKIIADSFYTLYYFSRVDQFDAAGRGGGGGHICPLPG